VVEDEQVAPTLLAVVAISEAIQVHSLALDLD
jgi:hypothetical protein